MIAYAVSTVTGREAACASVVGQLPPEATRVYLDDPPSGGSWSNYRRALEDAPTRGCDWLVSVDDDAHLCNDFPAHVERALAVCPGDFASFYCSYAKTMTRARAAGASWLATIRVVHGICFAIRSQLAQEVIDTSAKLVRPSYYSGDQRLLAWLAHTKRSNYILVPNLVDHRPDLRSAIFPERANAERHSAWFEQDPSARVFMGRTYLEGLKTPVDTMRVLRAKGALLAG